MAKRAVFQKSNGKWAHIKDTHGEKCLGGKPPMKTNRERHMRNKTEGGEKPLRRCGPREKLLRAVRTISAVDCQSMCPYRSLIERELAEHRK